MKQISDADSYHEACTALETCVREKIAALETLGVNLVISTEPISEIASSLLAEGGIAAVQVMGTCALNIRQDVCILTMPACVCSLPRVTNG